jgi:membrane associated rhomboid family serine protease
MQNLRGFCGAPPGVRHKRFGPLVRCVLIGGTLGVIYGVAINLSALDQVAYWYADGLWCANVGAFVGFVIGVFLDLLYCRTKTEAKQRANQAQRPVQNAKGDQNAKE